MKPDKYLLSAQLIVAALFSVSTLAAGGENPLWLSTTLRSYHADRSAGYNERNSGIGLEYHFNRDWGLAAGEYKNSFAHKSKYYGFAYTPFSRGDWKLGALVVKVSGYDSEYVNRYTPVVVPLLVWEHNHFGVNTVIVPPTGNKTGVLAVQLKLTW